MCIPLLLDPDGQLNKELSGETLGRNTSEFSDTGVCQISCLSNMVFYAGFGTSHNPCLSSFSYYLLIVIEL